MLCLYYYSLYIESQRKTESTFISIFLNLHIWKRDVGPVGKTAHLQRDAWPICKVRTYQAETSQKIWPLPQEKKQTVLFASQIYPPPPPFLPWKICLWSNRWAFDCLELWRRVLAVEKVQVRPPSASAVPQAFRLKRTNLILNILCLSACPSHIERSRLLRGKI